MFSSRRISNCYKIDKYKYIIHNIYFALADTYIYIVINEEKFELSRSKRSKSSCTKTLDISDDFRTILSILEFRRRAQ